MDLSSLDFISEATDRFCLIPMKEDRFEYNFDDGIYELAKGEIVRVIYTQPNHEGRLLDFCKAHGIVCYLPLKKVWKPMTQRHDGKIYQYPKVVLRPMFPNYMFVKMMLEQRTLLFNSKSIIRILQDSDELQPKLLDEIRVIRQIENIAKDEDIEFNAELTEGDKFLIENGPWQGVFGWLKKKKNRFLWMVEIECVGTIVRATIDPSQYKMTRVEE